MEAGWLIDGDHVIQWNGRDDHGLEVASGAYVARIRAGDEELTRTLLLIR
jgi:flagellar hook assembly protein FlgD